MAATVPERRVSLVQSGVGIAQSVRTTQWIGASQLQCWLGGRGSQVVPAYSPPALDNQGAVSDFYFWTKPRYQTTRYALSIILYSEDPAARLATITAPVGGTTHTLSVNTTRRPTGGLPGPRAHTIYFDRASRSSTEAELSFRLGVPDVAPIQIDSVAIEAVPRTLLDIDTSDLGSSRLLFRPRQPIIVTAHSDTLLESINNLRDACRREGLFQHAWSEDDYAGTTSGSFTELFSDPIGISHRYLYDGETTRLASWRVRAMVSNGTTAGEVRVTNSAGSTTIAIPNTATSWTWLPSTAGAASTFAIATDDNTEADGLRGGTHDDHIFEIRRTAGAGVVQLSGISVFDGAA